MRVDFNRTIVFFLAHTFYKVEKAKVVQDGPFSCQFTNSPETHIIVGKHGHDDRLRALC